ncbi:MAG: integrase/recombinase XerD, partial [Cyclobacteriaceae bacterium]
YGKNDFPLSKLKLQFLHDFEYYLKTERRQSQVTINKCIQRLRKPIKEALGEGYLEKDPFVQHKPGRVRKEVIFLSTDELKLLEEHHFTQPRLQLVKDLFIFCCYTGLAYHEMSNLKKEHIIKGFDGNEWIQMKREKTDKMISIPLLPKAKVILEKYHEVSNHALPKFSNQKINSYLKEIAGIVGINKPISHHMARKTFASTVLLYNDVPMEIVSELLGHSSMKITQEYYGKIVQKRISKEMKRLSKKFN